MTALMAANRALWTMVVVMNGDSPADKALLRQTHNRRPWQ